MRNDAWQPQAWIGAACLAALIGLSPANGWAEVPDQAAGDWASKRERAMEAALEQLSAAESPAVWPEVWLHLPAGRTLPRGRWQADFDYTFQRDNFHTQVFNLDQTQLATRSQHRKTHLVTWRLQYGLTDRVQPEAEVVYRAYRQHTHGNGDFHDRNDDGDFERLLTGLSYQAVQESESLPAVRVRSSALLPRRAETEGIGQELGWESTTAVSKALGLWRWTGSVGMAMTYNNHDHPADPVFNDTPISKAHDLRRLSYGFGVLRPLNEHWQANMELTGSLAETIERNERQSRSVVQLTPGVLFRTGSERWQSWLGVGIPVGLTPDAPHLGVTVRTLTRF